jgi:hypothetical protein
MPLELELEPVLGVVDGLAGAGVVVVDDEPEVGDAGDLLVEVCANAPAVARVSVEKAMTALMTGFISFSSGS